VRTLKIFLGTHILGASRGLLCDSSAVLLLKTLLKLTLVMHNSNVEQYTLQIVMQSLFLTMHVFVVHHASILLAFNIVMSLL